MSTVREIAFEVTLEGKGVVQKDRPEQQYAYINSENSFPIDQLNNSNINFSKANYYLNPKYTGEPDNKAKKYIRKLKISGAALRHAIHEAVMPFHTPQFFQNPAIRKDILSSMDYILRGYMYAPSNGSSDAEVIRRAKAYSISDAEEVSGAIPTIEVSSTAGPRSGNSFFYMESVGETKYVATGNVDIAQLQFISASANADRMALNAEDLIAVSEEMKKKYGENSFKEGYYHLLGAPRPLAEKGIVLSDEFVVKMCNYLFDLISKMHFSKQSAFAKVTQIKVKLISDPSVEFSSDESNWNIIFDREKLVRNFNLNFEPHHFYAETSLDEIERHNRIALEIESKIKASKDQKAAAKKNKE